LYLLLSQFSAWVSQPVFTLNERSNVALFSALLLGLIGAMAPCQLSASVGAMTYFGNRQMQNSHVSWREMIWYLVGKMTVLGCARMLLGPLLILIGIFLLGWIRLPGVGARFSAALNQCARKWGGNSGAFLMGVAFSLGFCPTMFWLFFGLLMPLTMDVEYGLMLPPLFAVGTALPLLLFLGISYGVGRHRLPIRKARQVGRWVQRVAGVFFILLGIADMMIFWDHMLAFCAF